MIIKIQKAIQEDFRVLLDLGRKTFFETWKDYNTEADMKAYLAEAFDESRILQDISDSKNNTFLLALADDVLAGYAKLNRGNSHAEFRKQTAIEVERVYVRKEFQGRGIGKSLMDESLRLAIEEKFDWIWLGVNIDNKKAIAFYQSFGFEIFGKKMFRLGEAEDPDYLMKKQLKFEK